eukprot:TRINITY_DN1445_c0_g1_i1.p1 TRINITY_DN1445_c0_g1~~TRINITY_DN1445_c0_g1_i1.p1  ORF type:complete len:384 (+),score=35.32 TRINITY_DN1445_c0_g1_i1:187-1338(+)
MSFDSNFPLKENGFSYNVQCDKNSEENYSVAPQDVPHVYNATQLNKHTQNSDDEQVKELILEELIKGGIHSAVEMILDFFSETYKNERNYKFLQLEWRKYQEGNCLFDFVTLRKVLSTYVDLKERDFHLIFRALDVDCTGYISLEDFNNWLFGSLEEKRLQIILFVFQRFRCIENNCVEMNEICNSYNQTQHPDVINYKRSSNQVFKEFIELVSQYAADNHGVAIDAFIQYHRALSVCIVHDDEFIQVVNAMWSKTSKVKPEMSAQKEEEDSEKLNIFEDKFSRINSSCSSNKESNIFTNVSPFQSSSNKTGGLFSSSDNNTRKRPQQGSKKEFDGIKCQVKNNIYNKENIENKNTKSLNSEPSVKSIAEINRKKMMTSSIKF